MTTQQPETPRAVIVVSSHVARGSVGNRAAVFALETLGFPVWAVPTVILPWHTGHGPSTRIVPDRAQFSAFMSDIAQSAWLGEVGAVLSGYLGNAEQAADVASIVRSVKTQNPNALYVCVADVAGQRKETAIELAPNVLSLCRRHPEMGPCQYERDLCRKSGGHVFTADGREITRAVEDEYDRKVMRVRFRAN